MVLIFRITGGDGDGGDDGGGDGDPSFSSSGVCDTWPCHCRDLPLAGAQTQANTGLFSQTNGRLAKTSQ